MSGYEPFPEDEGRDWRDRSGYPPFLDHRANVEYEASQRAQDRLIERFIAHANEHFAELYARSPGSSRWRWVSLGTLALLVADIVWHAL